MIELSASFVPATDDMTHLRTFGADTDFFARFSEDGHYGGDKGPYGTRQGYYAVAPSGKLLGSTNKRDPKIIAGILKDALEKYAKLPPSERLLGAKDIKDERQYRNEEALYPDDGLVLLEYVKDLPEPGADMSTVSGNWNLDYVWLLHDEAALLVPKGDKPGASVSWSRDIAQRFARFHLIDTVNGLRYSQKPMFAEKDIKLAKITSTVESVEGKQVKLRFEGTTDATSTVPRERGVKLKLLRHATWDRSKKKFIAFELVGVGRRWGGTGDGKSNDRAGETEPKPIGFTFKLAGDSPAEHVPPMYVHAYGW